MRIIVGVLLACLATTASPAWAACTAPECTKLIDNGPDAGKKVLVVLGDGYAAADQNAFNGDVDEMVVQGLFGNDFFRDHQNAFNVYRVNLVSAQSGVSQRVYDEQGTPKDASDDTVVSTTMKNTALKIIYSGSWAHCWLEYSASTEFVLQAVISATVPNADFMLILLNEDGVGGCGGNGRQHVTSGESWSTVAHEAGHGIGGLHDEYGGAGPYEDGPVNNRNCSTVLNKSTVFWNRFIDPATPVPTTFTAGMASNKTVGEFEGCHTKDTGIYRPVLSCRMKTDWKEFCPVCQTLMRKDLYPTLDHDFSDTVTGDFNGDGRSDVLIHNGNDIAIYRAKSTGQGLDQVWIANNSVPSAPASSYFWTLSAGDNFHVADFDGDGKDDVFVFNATSWSQTWIGLLRSNGTGLETVIHYGGQIGGFWTLTPSDRVQVADFDGDGKDDVILFNGIHWSQPWLLMARSTGAALALVEKYASSIPGWTMASNDHHFVADFDGNGRDDLYVFNGINWSNKYLGLVKSSGVGLSLIKLYTNTLASGWQMGQHDQHFVGDIDGDLKDDLYVWNRTDWPFAYLELTRSTGTALNFVNRYDNDAASASGNVPGWILTKGDRLFPADANKDGKTDLFIYNTTDWSTEYLGTLMSSGSSLTGSSSGDSVGGWNLGPLDKVLVANYEGGAGKADIFIRNNERFGLLRRAAAGFVMDRIYYHSIYTPLYDSKPWSDSMP